MPDMKITIPGFTITVHDAEITPEHACGPNCDCPAALARTQQAIDTARAQDGLPGRPLSERLHAMRHATPDSAWFEHAATEARQLETSRTPDDRPRDQIKAMHETVRDTVLDLERADLIPTDHEYTYVSGMQECHVYTGNLRFIVGMTGMSDTPANCYVVSTSSDADDEPVTERFADDVGVVRAWLLAWAAKATYDQRHRDA